MKKTKLTTTLKLLIQREIIFFDYQKIIDFLGVDYPTDAEINLLTVLESNGLRDFFSSFQATCQPWKSTRILLINIVSDIAESVLPLFEQKFPTDDRPRKAIEAARRCIHDPSNEATDAAAHGAHCSVLAAKAADALRAADTARAAASATYLAILGSPHHAFRCAVDAAEYAARADPAAKQKHLDIITKYLE